MFINTSALPHFLITSHFLFYFGSHLCRDVFTSPVSSSLAGLTCLLLPRCFSLLSCLHLATLYFGQLKASGVGDAIKHVYTGSDGQRCRDQRPTPSFSLLLYQYPPLSSSSPPPAWWLHLHPPPPPSVHMSCPSDGLVSDLVPNAT